MASFFAAKHPNVNWGEWYKEESLVWINKSLFIIKDHYSELTFLFSFDDGNVEIYNKINSSMFDLFEHHIWRVQQNGNEFYKLIIKTDGSHLKHIKYSKKCRVLL